MKRIIAIALTLMMVLALCGCDTVPPEMNKDTYKLGQEALGVMDKYLAGSINAGEAEEKLTAVYAAVEEVVSGISTDASDPNYVNNFNYSQSARSVAFSVKSFVLGIRGEENSLGKIPDCQESRDFLYSTLTGADQNKG